MLAVYARSFPGFRRRECVVDQHCGFYERAQNYPLVP